MSPADTRHSHVVAAQREEPGMGAGRGSRGPRGVLKELLQGLHLQQLLLDSCPRCHTAHSCFQSLAARISCPNQTVKKEETHSTTATSPSLCSPLSSFPPNLQIYISGFKPTYSERCSFPILLSGKELLLESEVASELVHNCSISSGRGLPMQGRCLSYPPAGLLGEGGTEEPLAGS